MLNRHNASIITMINYKAFLRELLEAALTEQASDLHISAGDPPILRVAGQLIPLRRKKKLTAEDSQGLAFAMMTEDQHQRFLKERAT